MFILFIKIFVKLYVATNKKMQNISMFKAYSGDVFKIINEIQNEENRNKKRLIFGNL